MEEIEEIEEYQEPAPKVEWVAERRRLKDLKSYERNPRKISEEAIEKAKESIRERGYHGVLKVFNDVILAGNQAKKVLKEMGIEEVITLKPVKPGTKETYPLTEEEQDLIVIESNRNWGQWDFEELVKRDIDLLRKAGFEEFELGFKKDEERLVDQDKLTKTLDTYLEGNIKQIVLLFPSSEYQDIIDRMTALMQKMEVEDNTSVFLKLLEFYEKANP